MTPTISINDSQSLQLLPLEVSKCLLLGPAPSNAHPAVLQAMNTTLLGHLDPAFLALMDVNLDCATYRTQKTLTL
jgi:alanine-glyoxylate transaminase/serine-glyoxylate transaminase/serine-pyruvate transaminase